MSDRRKASSNGSLVSSISARLGIKSSRQNTSKLGNGKDDAEEAQYKKRREQVRRAQRNHRAKKDVYVKSLEEELTALRASQAKLEQRAIEAESELKRYRSSLQEGHDYLAGQLAEPAVNINYDELGKPRLHVELSASDPPSSISSHIPSTRAEAGDESLVRNSAASHIASGYRQTPATGYGVNGKPGDQMSDLSASFSQQLSHRDEPNHIHPAGLVNGDSPEVGINFVLSLEHPCFTHIISPLGSSEPTGHTMQAQSQLMGYRSPAPANSDDSWSVPAVEIEKLLKLSLKLNLFSELTPVQAWQQIKSHPNFAQCDHAKLEALQSKLLAEVQCYGFGAVIDWQIFKYWLKVHLEN